MRSCRRGAVPDPAATAISTLSVAATVDAEVPGHDVLLQFAADERAGIEPDRAIHLASLQISLRIAAS